MSVEHAVLWQDGKQRNLGTLGGDQSEAVALNERGQVVGWSEVTAKDPRYSTPLRHAFLWQRGKMTDLGTLPGNDRKGRPWIDSWAVGITESGDIVGTCNSAGNARHGFIWRNGTMTDLGTLGGSVTEPYDINERGQVVGWSVTATGKTHAFLWENGKMTDLGTLGPRLPRNVAVAINDQGQVIGRGETSQRKGVRAFVWEDGKMLDLGTLPAAIESGPVAINNAGEIVGWSGDDDSYIEGMHHAVLWTLKP